MQGPGPRRQVFTRPLFDFAAVRGGGIDATATDPKTMPPLPFMYTPFLVPGTDYCCTFPRDTIDTEPLRTLLKVPRKLVALTRYKCTRGAVNVGKERASHPQLVTWRIEREREGGVNGLGWGRQDPPLGS